MVTYDEHLAWLIREERGARAERQGFTDRKTFPRWDGPIRFSSEAYEQDRYDIGFYTAQTKLEFEPKKETA